MQAQLQHLQRQPPSSRTSTAAMSNAASLRTTFSSVALSRTASMSFTQRSVSHSPRLTTFRSDDEDDNLGMWGDLWDCLAFTSR